MLRNSQGDTEPMGRPTRSKTFAGSTRTKRQLNRLMERRSRQSWGRSHFALTTNKGIQRKCYGPSSWTYCFELSLPSNINGCKLMPLAGLAWIQERGARELTAWGERAETVLCQVFDDMALWLEIIARIIFTGFGFGRRIAWGCWGHRWVEKRISADGSGDVLLWMGGGWLSLIADQIK